MESVKFNENSDLLEAIRYFSNPMVCLEAASKVKWPKGPECPRCQGKKLSFLKTRLMWTCLACRKQFSVKVGTIFEDSPIGLGKWLTAMWMLTNCKNGVSSYEIARVLQITQKTAWPRWSPQKRPVVVTSKPASWSACQDKIVIPCRAVFRQSVFRLIRKFARWSWAGSGLH